MLDFRGWADNWMWMGSIGDPPSWRAVLIAGGFGLAGCGAVGLSWVSTPALPPAAVVGTLIVVLLVIHGLMWIAAPRLMLLSVFHTLALAGALAGLALLMDAGAREHVARWGPVAALAGLPILVRIHGATLFSLELVHDIENKQARLERALAGEGGEHVVRVDQAGETLLGTLIGSDGEQPVVIAASLTKRALKTGSHLLVTRPRLERGPDGKSYRDAPFHLTSARRCEWVPDISRSAFVSEVRAGVVVAVAHHALIAAAVLLWAGAAS